MALKKSDLYASIWSAADVLRGGMDASQYKDYVLTLLFMKYVTDRAGRPDSLIELPAQEPPEDKPDATEGYGGSFKDMIYWKGKTGIGQALNQIVARFARHNGLSGSITTANFNDPEKLGKDKEMIDRLSKLIGIFQSDDLDFSGNRAGDDDLLGDAYEYLMRNFATQSGKSKGQFYTPAEVSRIMAAILNVERADSANFTAYDPTCGSGSLLLKVAEVAPVDISIYGQERDIATTGLAVMNMWLHDRPTAVIKQGNTLSDPRFTEVRGGKEMLKRFDVIVANPPFSVKEWSNGFEPESDTYDRFTHFGMPPQKNGDFAFLLHILASLKTGGTAAIVLPHGVLFRGNAEADIRRRLLEAGVIKGIIGLPANLFYGTGIPACLIVMEKSLATGENLSPGPSPGERGDVADVAGGAAAGAVFLLDASKGFRKDGPKNRLRDRDIDRIIEVFNEKREEPGYSRSVPLAEIAANDYNLNLPRYLDSRDEADRQDLEGHLRGGIPQADIDALEKYWRVFPQMRNELFTDLRPGYLRLTDEKPAVENYEEFQAFQTQLTEAFDSWFQSVEADLNGIDEATKPRSFIRHLGTRVRAHYDALPLVDAYAVYQHLMDYWEATLQDDLYTIIASGWTAELAPEMTGSGDKQKVRKGYFTCALLPPEIVRDHFLSPDVEELATLENKIADTEAHLAELLEEEGGEDGLLAEVVNDKGKITKGDLNARRKALKGSRDPEEQEELRALNDYANYEEQRGKFSKAAKALEADTRKRTYARYDTLTPELVQDLVVNHKWYAALQGRISAETTAVGQALNRRLGELATRYDRPLSELETEVEQLSATVNAHLAKMGLTW
ncbi:SAM-dependent DNA methyltransferase [Neolewinella aurantiaca]|uniref:site-specific DNA-methyltransferase (adenine-specific) n=1 Tax=Neolewinella aurantiaca TaxID=2602767 RepID=A0A5C7FI44_9BACT|nr:class I SAM-dependent DNA methyltransferase [Neolewinella aurantiaca]TXF85964.1 SAM-dependent DNA methyltransferase [Neolewinella aurantiaca]